MADEEIQGAGGPLAPPSETVHLPDPSFQPILVAFAVTVILFGVVKSWIICGFGILLLLYVLAKWIRDVRNDISDLPLEHH
ncbi:MAG: hypothetical protein H0V29_02310 [Thermoleophilaceae bacterium]|nr:hypothetical protein [Thermoleophilaceae bacterium]